MNQSIKTILISAFCMNLAGFAVLSFLAVYLSHHLLFSVGETGTVLSLMTLSSRGLPIFAGGMGDRYGYKNMMGIGLLIRGSGFILLAFAQSFFFIGIGTTLIGIGSACYEPSSMAFFSSEATGENKKRIFTYLNLSLNGGAIIGPLLGGYLLLLDPSYPFIISGLTFYILFFFQFIIIKPQRKIVRNRNSIVAGVKQIVTNKRFMNYCFAMIFFWFMFAQLTVSIPLHMYNLSKNESLVTIIITVNAVTGLVFMFLFRRLYVKINIFTLLKIGIVTMSCSLFMIVFTSTPYWLLICILFFTIGETLVLPSSDIAISEFTQEKFQGSYYGFFEISFAVGATFGNYAGSFLINQQPSSFIPWIVFSGVGMIGFLLIWLLNKKPHCRILRELEDNGRQNIR
ncbi:MFS transporter [Neobacillus sp. PS3-34]|uniref:MDR family MFS transporter n=1 Tax=Neobacillus sp. PS3-34 TaxID=3070678 RepID=UPI0027E0C194|nr:MFS transporter [Neobacillus sp. PS3-34]WML48364.1 MFS transporter [Neobacillus sp. PS3-34]